MSSPPGLDAIFTAFTVPNGPTATWASGKLTVSIPANSTNSPSRGFFGAGIETASVLKGDFSIEVDYLLATWPPFSGVRLGLIIASGAAYAAAERVSLNGAYGFAGGQREVYLADISGSIKFTNTSDAAGKLRLVRTGATLTAFAFSGGQWVAIHTATASAGDATITVMAWSADYTFIHQAAEVVFENLTLNSGVIDPPLPVVTPPVITVPSTLTAEATSPIGAVVSFNPTAVASGGQPVPVTCTPPSGSTFLLGTTTVACTATDASGNTATASFDVNVVDTRSPILTLPPAPTADATGPAGASVTFAATADDVVDGSVTVTCVPASGSTFPIGTTPVVCSAADMSGNTATGTFVVTVVGAAAQLATLRTACTGVGPGTSLADKVQEAIVALNAGNKTEACNKLRAFIQQVRALASNGHLPASTAAQLIADASRIRAVLGC